MMLFAHPMQAQRLSFIHGCAQFYHEAYNGSMERQTKRKETLHDDQTDKKKRREEIIDKIYDITKTYPELFEQYYNTDSMELDVDNVPQKFKKTAIEYNKLRRELLSLPKTSIFKA